MLDKVQHYVYRCQNCFEFTNKDLSICFYGEYGEEVGSWRVFCSECLLSSYDLMTEFEHSRIGFVLADVPTIERLFSLFIDGGRYEGNMHLYKELIKMVLFDEKPEI